MRLAAALALTVAAAPAVADPIVVELFTSQGCSSCPPADVMLGELAAREDLIVLSLHVDYWDWIGWADTFADPKYSARQRGYAATAGSTAVYTPQFVIGGQEQIAGARGMKVAEAIQAHSASSTEVLEVEGDQLILTETGTPAAIIIVDVMPEAEVEILRGENAGRDITYHHIVQDWTVLGEWDGAAGQLSIPPADTEGTVRVVLAQEVVGNGYPGAIIGAARID